MLGCGRNFKGNKPKICSQCKTIDDENHRLNYCIKYRETNLYDCDVKEDFQKVFSSDIVVCGKFYQRSKRYGTVKPRMVLWPCKIKLMFT